MPRKEFMKLLDLPVNKIMEVVFYEALSDKEISDDELAILDGIKLKFSDIRQKYMVALTEKGDQKEISKSDISGLLQEQKKSFEETIMEAERIAKEDGVITEDESEIFKAISETVEEILSEKMQILKDM
ncbi:MAG: hypothetical protein ACXAD7_20065 [Candidatus Kariarchaeaceae archaeon]